MRDPAAALREAQAELNRIWRELEAELQKDVARIFDRLVRQIASLPAEPEVTRMGTGL